MKHLFCLLLLCLPAATLPAQDPEVRRQDAKELDAAFSQEAKPLRRPGGIPGMRGARPTAPEEQFRVYTRGARIITYSNGKTAEAPYVEIPLLFGKGKAKLLPDPNTQANVHLLTSKIKEYGEKGARFVIEGHASAEGSETFNQTLSEKRAAALRGILIKNQGVDPAFLQSTSGFGSHYAHAPANAAEAELQQERRVLVIKEQ